MRLDGKKERPIILIIGEFRKAKAGLPKFVMIMPK
jgi:hypothetical protein